jgi:general secretion pathway protein D
VEQLDRREPAETVTYAPGHYPARDVARLIEQTVRAGSPPDDRWRVVEDELTGSLVVTATPSQHARVRELVERLDSAPAAARRPVRSFVVRNRSVKEVKGIVEGLVQAGVLEADAGGPAAGSGPPAGGGTPRAPDAPPAAPGGPTPSSSPTSAASTPLPLPPAISSEPGRASTRPAAAGVGAPEPAPPRGPGGGGASPLVLTADEGTNTLIAVGEPRALAQLEALLRTIDVRQPQVMLEVLMVTLSDSQAVDLGVEIEKLAVHGDTRMRLSSLFGLGTRSSGGDRDGPLSASGLTGVVLNPGDFSVVLRALETLSSGRSVSMPRILVGNNQQATLDSTLQQPYASQSLINSGSGTVNTSFGGTLDAGTTLSIKPQIAEGDHLILDYSVSLSAFTGAASASTLPPPRQQNKVQSQAAIPDGHTVVVGGIEVATDGRTTGQVPLIGSIPVLGEAFKNRSASSSRSRFYVFIRANVLRSRSFEDLRYASEPAAAAAGIDDGWPEVEPRVIR